MDVLFGVLIPRSTLRENDVIRIVGEDAALGSWTAEKGPTMKLVNSDNGQDPFLLWLSFLSLCVTV
jgi:hypothetical protein